MRIRFTLLLPVLLLWMTAARLPAASPLTVLLDYEHPYSQNSFQALQEQLHRLLNSVGLDPDIRQRSAASAHEQFADVVLFQMRGRCSMQPLPLGALSDERGALAMAFSADGAVLPFGAVECDRVRQSLERILGRGISRQYESAYGAALGTVMAHEIYHMLAHSATHTREGLTKESLSARELLEGELSLPDIARHAIAQSEANRH